MCPPESEMKNVWPKLENRVSRKPNVGGDEFEINQVREPVLDALPRL